MMHDILPGTGSRSFGEGGGWGRPMYY